ncbi:MAG: AAA family ATPase, partial [Hymenobacter sp.]
MINLNIAIVLPQLWQDKTFTKNDWNSINLIVGPNGTGKSLFADQLKQQLSQNGLRVRLLNAERLAGLEKREYSYFTNGSNLKNGFNISQFNDLKRHGDDFGWCFAK